MHLNIFTEGALHSQKICHVGAFLVFNSALETCAGKSAALFVAPFNLCATDSCPRVHGRRTPRFSILLLVIVVFRKHFCLKCSHEMALSCSLLPKILRNKLLSL